MKTLLIKSLAIASLIIVTAPAFSAGYIKIDGVEGESHSPAPAPAEKRVAKPEEQPTALLLPAVQKAQEPSSALLLPAVQKAQEPAKPRPTKGKVEASWKVEEGKK